MKTTTHKISRYHRSPQSRTAGFTLLEMIVASSIFIVAVLVIVGAVASLDNASRKARTMRIATDNLSAAIDVMSRNIRMGSHFHCGCGSSGSPSTSGDATFPNGLRNCSMTDTAGNGGDVCLALEGQFGNTSIATDQLVYRLFSNRIQRSVDGGATYEYITAPELTITSLRFFAYGTTEDQDQPAITMIIRGKAPLTKATLTDFNIETTLSPRTPNFSTP